MNKLFRAKIVRNMSNSEKKKPPNLIQIIKTFPHTHNRYTLCNEKTNIFKACKCVSKTLVKKSMLKFG